MRGALPIVLMAALLRVVAAQEHTTSLLRYAWRPGDHLVYERRVRIEPADGAGAPRTKRQQLQVWCLDRDTDGALLLLEVAHALGTTARCLGGLTLRIDDRGRKQIAPEWSGEIEAVEPLLDLLVEFGPAVQVEPTYLTQPDRYGRRYRCTPTGPDPRQHGLMRIDLVREDPTGVSALLGEQHRGSVWFDPRLRAVARAEFQSQDAGGRRSSLARLYVQNPTPAAWRRRRKDELRQLLRTLRLEQRAYERLLAYPGDAPRALNDVQRYWEELLRSMPDTSSPLRRIAEAHRRRRAAEAPAWRERARLAARWLNRQAADWSLPDLDGRLRRSEEFRDRPVLEVFWSTGSPESLRSFEVLRRLREAVPESALSIVCLNLDSDVSAARRAALTCGQGLPHVLAGPPVGADPPSTLPVLRLLNTEGRVVRVDFGWRSSWRDFVDPVVSKP